MSEPLKIIKLDPHKITIPRERLDARARDIDDIVADIQRHGQLTPITVKADHTIRIGVRRTLACRKLEIDVEAIVRDDGDDLEIEAAENNIRKSATFSQKIAYTKAMYDKLTKELGERRGRPSNENSAESCGILKGTESRRYVASLCGWSSYEEMRLGLEVAEKGIPELVESLDSGTIKSITRAHRIAVARPGMQVKMVRRSSAEDSMAPAEFDKLVADERHEKKKRFERRLSQRAVIKKNAGKYQYLYAHPRTATDTNNLPEFDINIVAKERCIVALKLGHSEIGIAHQCFTNWGISDIEIVQVVGDINLPTTTVVEQESYLLVFGIRGNVTPVKKLPAFIVEDKAPLHSTVHSILRKLQPAGWLDMFGTEPHHGFAIVAETEQEASNDQADE